MAFVILIAGLSIPLIQTALSDLRQSGLRALELNGLDGFAQSNSNQLLVTSVTLVFWVYETQNWPTGNILVGAFASDTYDAYRFPSINSTGYGLLLEQNGGARWAIGNSTLGEGCYVSSGAGLIRPGIWTLLAGEYDSASHILLMYNNGSTLVSSIPGCLMKYQNPQFQIGLPLPASNLPDRPVDLFNVQVYNRALSPLELDTLYQEGVSGSNYQSGLIAGWISSASQDSGRVLSDLTGHGNNAVLYGTTQWVANIPLNPAFKISLPPILPESIFLVIFSLNGFAWLTARQPMGARTDDWRFFSACTFLLSGALGYYYLSDHVEGLTFAIGNALLASIVIALGGRFRIVRSGKMTYVALLARDAPARFLAFGSFAFLILSTFSILLERSLPLIFYYGLYSMLFGLVASLLFLAVRADHSTNDQPDKDQT